MKNIYSILILLPMIACAQDEINSSNERKLILVGGFGLPDWVHTGLNYSLTDRTTVGASIWYGVLNGEVAFQFGKRSVYSVRPAFYWSQRLNYQFNGNKAIFFVSGIGRNLYIENNFGINLDVGLAKQVYYKEDKSNCAPECDGQGLQGILPSGRLQIFVKLK